MEIKQYRYISHGLVGLVFCFALLSSAFLISGDQYGKVNLLFLLLLFVAWPLFSLVLSLVSAFSHSKRSSASLLLSLPIWPTTWQLAINDLKRAGTYPFWLFAQGQKLALTFSVASLIAFLFVLLFNDVTFVWRSTLLSADQIFPVLSALAKPWFFIEAAQPLPEMVRIAQDSRLSVNSQLTAAGSWWLYVLMSQVFYAIFPRSVLFVWGKVRLSRYQLSLEKKTKSTYKAESELGNAFVPQAEPLKDVEQLASQSQEYVLLSGVTLPEILKQALYKQIGPAQQEYELNAQENAENEVKAIQDSRKKVLIVAAWEPPLGELADFMALTEGVIIPIDWRDEQFCQLSELHLDEWRRFCHSMKQWQLQLLEVS